MTKRDIITLLCPSVFLFLFAVALILIPEADSYKRRHTDNGYSQQRYETFVSSVKSGKLQPTTDMWLKHISDCKASVEAFEKADISMVEFIKRIGWVIFSFIFLQVIVVFEVKKRLTKS